MGLLRRRIRAAEERAYGGPRPPCPKCGGLIVLEEIGEDGTSVFPHGGPCEACGSAPPWPGAITRIVVDMRDPKDVPEEDSTVSAEWPP